jgi:type IV secretion system protein VirB3
MERAALSMDGPESPRRIPVHASLLRPVLLGGADRECALANGIVCLALLFGIGVSRYTIAVVVFLLTIGHGALMRITKSDPLFREVYLRHVRLGSYYAAAGGVAVRAYPVYPAVSVTE